LKIDEMDLFQVNKSLAKLESLFRNFQGNVNILVMSDQDPAKYAEWRSLRDRRRNLLKGATGEVRKTTR
jgi:hypothetical protein